MTLPTLIIGSEVENVLSWEVKTLKGVSMLNGGRAIVKSNRCVPLHITGLTNGIDP